MTAIRFHALALILLAAGCSAHDLAPARDAGVNRVFANVRGVT